MPQLIWTPGRWELTGNANEPERTARIRHLPRQIYSTGHSGFISTYTLPSLNSITLSISDSSVRPIKAWACLITTDIAASSIRYLTPLVTFRDSSTRTLLQIYARANEFAWVSAVGLATVVENSITDAERIQSIQFTNNSMVSIAFEAGILTDV